MDRKDELPAFAFAFAVSGAVSFGWFTGWDADADVGNQDPVSKDGKAENCCPGLLGCSVVVLSIMRLDEMSCD